MRKSLLAPLVSDRWCGTVGYKAALDLQETCAKEVQKTPKGKGVLLGLEHPNTISLGLRAQPEKDLMVDPEEFKGPMGFELHYSRRGGEATLHSQGQLVIYPILPLRIWRWGVRNYVEFLMRVTQKTLEQMEIDCFSSEGEPGLYTEIGKIAFFGVQVSGGVSRHGLSINVSNNLDYFCLIRSCGVSAQNMDRVVNHVPGAISLGVFRRWVEVWHKESVSAWG